MKELLMHDSVRRQIMDRINGKALNVCLFGNKGMGKERVARMIAAADLGVSVDELNSSNEFLYLEPSGKSITVDMLKCILEPIQFNSDKKYVLLINEANCMSEYVQNKLLKILEDGSARCTVLLVSHMRLINTVMSRCINIEFPSFTYEMLENYFQENNVYALLGCRGTPGNYLRIMKDKDFLKKVEQFFNHLLSISNREALVSILEQAHCYKENDSKSFATNFEGWQLEAFFLILTEIYMQATRSMLNVDLNHSKIDISNVVAVYTLEELIYLTNESLRLSKICTNNQRYNKNDFFEFLMHMIEPNVFMEVKE